MNQINCNQCGVRYVGLCACPKTLRVTSGSHKVKITWMQGCFVAVSADEAGVVSESQAEYLRSWPYSNYTFTAIDPEHYGLPPHGESCTGEQCDYPALDTALDELLPPSSLDRIERDHYVGSTSSMDQVEQGHVYDESGSMIERQ